MGSDRQPFRPLLAAKIQDGNPEDIQFPVYASPKLDGIRVICHHELGPITRSAKPVPNNHIRSILSHPKLARLDGEVICGSLSDVVDFNTTQSAVMSADGKPKFSFVVFDHYGMLNIPCPYSLRINDYTLQVLEFNRQHMDESLFSLVPLVQHKVETWDQLVQLEETFLENGFEGLMFRSPSGPYKQNRSTFKQQILVKMKRYIDAEAVITGWEPLERNQNEAYIDDLGYQKRSSHKEGKVVDNERIGKFVCVGINGRFKDVEFRCGSGLNDEQRLRYAANFTSEAMGKVMTYKYQDFGSKDAPRQPIFKCLREAE